MVHQVITWGSVKVRVTIEHCRLAVRYFDDYEDADAWIDKVTRKYPDLVLDFEIIPLLSSVVVTRDQDMRVAVRPGEARVLVEGYESAGGLGDPRRARADR